MKKIIIQVVLTLGIIVLAVALWKSVTSPLDFKKEYDERKDEVVQRLKDIRDIQLAYKFTYGTYNASFDTLQMFFETDSLPIVTKTDNTPQELTEKSQEWLVENGYIIFDTNRVAVKDSLFIDREDFNIADISFVPFTNNEDQFEMECGTIVKTGFTVPVFEVRVDNVVFLKGMDEQDIRNFNKKLEDMERYPGLKVGSMLEASESGNWE